MKTHSEMMKEAGWGDAPKVSSNPPETSRQVRDELPAALGCHARILI